MSIAPSRRWLLTIYDAKLTDCFEILEKITKKKKNEISTMVFQDNHLLIVFAFPVSYEDIKKTFSKSHIEKVYGETKLTIDYILNQHEID